MKRILIVTAVMLASCLLYVGAAQADNLHLCDVNTVCNAGSVIPVSSTPVNVFVNGTSYSNSTLYLLVLTPASGNSGNWNTSNTLWNVLGVNPSQTYPTLASAISQESGATGLTPGSFSVQAFSQGAGLWNGSAQVTLPAGAIGTIYMVFVIDSNGNLVAVSPWSSSMVNVPEPSSLVLLAAGLLGFAALAGRKLFAA